MIVKKFSKFIVTVALTAVLCLGAVIGASAANKSTLKIQLTSKPTVINYGTSFTLKGTATSNYTINNISGYIFKSGETKSLQYSGAYNPKSKSVDIAKTPINTKLNFSKLSNGSYMLCIKATDTSGNTVKTDWVRFNVITKNQSSYSSIKMSITAKPSKIYYGSSFALKGTVSSNSKIKKLVAYLFEDGNPSHIRSSGNCKPNSKSVKLEDTSISSKLSFATLPVGNYLLYISAQDSALRTVNSGFIKFSVLSLENLSNLKISMSKVPTEVSKGCSYNLDGMITSNFAISDIAGFFFKKGETKNCMSSGHFNPNSKCVNIGSSIINQNLKFGKLAAGDYYLYIMATDKSGKKVNTGFLPFTVKILECSYHLDEDGYDMIKNWEGFIKYPVWDYHQWSVGYGCHCEEGEYPGGITREEADKLLRKYVTQEFEPPLNSFLIENNISVTQLQYDALIDFSFNLGCDCWFSDNFSKIRNMLLSGDYSDDEIEETFCLYCHAGGKVNDGLVKRRKAEADMFIDGKK